MKGPLQYALSSAGVQVVGESSSPHEVRQFAQKLLALADALEGLQAVDGERP